MKQFSSKSVMTDRSVQHGATLALLLRRKLDHAWLQSSLVLTITQIKLPLNSLRGVDKKREQVRNDLITEVPAEIRALHLLVFVKLNFVRYN